MHILVKLKSALEEAGYTEEQWKKLDEKTKKQYIKDHPNSKYAQKDKPAENKKSAMDLAVEEEENPMTTEEAKDYWDKYHNSDPVLREYTSYEDWYKDSKENGYIEDEVVEKEQYPYTDDKWARYTDYFGENEESVDRPKEYFSGELTIDNWENEPAKDSYFNDEMSYIGQGIKDAIGANSSGRLDIKYADGEDKDNAFISIADKDTGIIYNVIIDSYGIDIMDEDMTESYLAGEVENGYFEPNDLESVVQFLKKDILGDEDEDDYTEDDSEVMTTEEAKEYWKNNRTSDPILEGYDSFEEWYKESKENGYIKD